MFDAEMQVFLFKQKGLASNEYYEKFKDLVTNAECLGSDIRAHADQVEMMLEEIAYDPDMPTTAKKSRHARGQRINTWQSCSW